MKTLISQMLKRSKVMLLCSSCLHCPHSFFQHFQPDTSVRLGTADHRCRFFQPVPVRVGQWGLELRPTTSATEATSSGQHPWALAMNHGSMGWKSLRIIVFLHSFPWLRKLQHRHKPLFSKPLRSWKAWSASMCCDDCNDCITNPSAHI